MQGFQAPNPTSPTFSQLPGNGAMNVGSPSELGAMGSMGLNSNPQKPPTFPHTAAEPYTQQQSPFTPPYGQLQQQQQQQPQLQQQPYRHPHMQQQQQHPHQQQYPHQQHQHLQQQHYSQHFTQQQPQQQPLPQGPVVLSKERNKVMTFSKDRHSLGEGLHSHVCLMERSRANRRLVLLLLQQEEAGGQQAPQNAANASAHGEELNQTKCS
ncbi:hypothetical protein EPH_0013140 [Eimeria praecox]|uniref:Uncharacterized protein n=1 Tax=Eimeria praecox TaxID=51316 RepID=U6GYS7_9EIME|nr:hypothetical protein EPH_0013140 [Eimeria praecox]